MPALKIAVCVLTTQVEAALLKMCMGFSGVDATREDIWLMSGAVEGYGQGQEGERLLVKMKALGGLRTSMVTSAQDHHSQMVTRGL